MRGVLSQALMLLLYARLSRIGGQMERLAARFEAGRLWRRGPVGVASGKVEVEGRLRGRSARVWPGRFGWLVLRASYQAAGYGAQLRVILGTPEMVALLVAAPQAARILRPLCRMLAVEVSVLRPRGDAASADVAGVGLMGGAALTHSTVAIVGDEARKPKRLKRDGGDWGRIPLPKGVLAAARRQGFPKSR